MKRTDLPKSLARRQFLKGAGTAGAVAGVAAAASLGGRKAQAATPVADDKSGYRETEHVSTYYELARF